MTTPRQPRLDSSSTAQISDSAEVSPEAADHLGAPADLDEGALEQVRGPDPLAVLGGPAQGGDQGVEVAPDDRHRRGVGRPVVGHDRLQPAAGLGRRGGLVEQLPPAGLEVAVVALGQLRRHASDRVDGAALLVRRRPQLPHRLPEAGCPVGDDRRRRVQSAVDQVAAERKPRRVALTAPELQPEQHLAALERDAPGHQHTLGRRVVQGCSLR